MHSNKYLTTTLRTEFEKVLNEKAHLKEGDRFKIPRVFWDYRQVEYSLMSGQITLEKKGGDKEGYQGILRRFIV